MHAPLHPLTTDEPQPAWDIATLFPNQGEWGEEDYLSLDTQRLVEFTDGYVEVLPMPTTDHQFIARYLFRLLDAFVLARGLGEVFYEGTKARLRSGKIRLPDILLLGAGRKYRRTRDYFEGVALAMEVVSEDPRSQDRDWNRKRDDYARAGIPEYWIVDPQLKKIAVLKLVGQTYETHAEAGETGRIASALLPGFEVEAAAVWASGETL